MAVSPPATPPAEAENHGGHLSVTDITAKLPSLSNMFARSRTPSPEPALTPPPPAPPRRLVLLVVGLKPHRHLWTTSARPGESVVYYQLLNGCPAVVVPVKTGAPLLAWDTLTLEELWKVKLSETADEQSQFNGIISVLLEFLELCVDWARMVPPEIQVIREEQENQEKAENDTESQDEKREALRNALRMLVAGAVRSGENKAVRDDVDKERSGIAMWRIP